MIALSIEFLRCEAVPQRAKPGGIGDPLNGVRIAAQILINGYRLRKTQFRISASFPALEYRVEISGICFPTDFSVVGHQWEPSESVVRTHLRVVKTVLTIAPGAKNQNGRRIGIDYIMRPTWRHDDSFPRMRLHSKTVPGIVPRFFLSVDDGAPFPDLE